MDLLKGSGIYSSLIKRKEILLYSRVQREEYFTAYGWNWTGKTKRWKQSSAR